ncbi:MAG: hypothetical protein JXB06_10400 [Spirochaetales bacterium]|nr:hypothetical protein [Spirochaetales bacterium]
MNYQVVATLGPATDDEQLWRRLIEAGATAFRLNTSHIGLEDLERWLRRIARFLPGCSAAGRGFPIVLDLQASKWRIGLVETAELEPGAAIELFLGTRQEGDRGTGALSLPVPHADFFVAAKSCGSRIAVNDGKVMLQSERLHPERISARVLQGGEISTGKGITLVGSTYRVERLGDKDRRVVELAAGYTGVRFALSYVKDAAEMRRYRSQFASQVAGSAYLIAKLERHSALPEAGGIARSADELWVCRGDLGAEMGVAVMAEQVFRFASGLGKLSRPVLLAGQVLEHMSEHPAPTRSEISCLYEALRKGFRGVVLSDETSVGAHPVEACRTASMFHSR